MDRASHSFTPSDLERCCPGLYLLLNFITPTEEAVILSEIDNNAWDDRLRRRVQHYGYEFDYASRRVVGDHPLVPFPSSMNEILKGRIAGMNQLTVNEILKGGIAGMNQLTVNEYEPGAGIAAHIDTHSCFGDSMMSLSLGSGVVMRFVPASKGLPDEVKVRGKVCFWLPPRSLLVMEGPARFAFKHAIPMRATDDVDGEIIRRQRRVSLTFRSVRLPAVCFCAYPDACDSQDLILEPTRIAVREPLGMKHCPSVDKEISTEHRPQN